MMPTLTMTTFMAAAYGVMGFVALGGYIPQLIAFWKKPMLCLTTPLVTWVMWAIQTVVFHAYALLVNGDTIFIINTGLFMWATLACLAVQLYGRRKMHRAMNHTGNVVTLNPATPAHNVA